MADTFKSLELARTAWAIATGGEGAEAADPSTPFSRGVLKPGGNLVMKLLQGSGVPRMWARACGCVWVWVWGWVGVCGCVCVCD